MSSTISLVRSSCLKLTKRSKLTASTLTLALSLLVGQNAASAQQFDMQAASHKQETAPAAPFGPLNPANWRMPEFKLPSFRSVLPGNDEQARIKKKKDGLVSEVRQSATNSWAKTKQVFNPQKLNPVNFFTASAKQPSKKPADMETKPNFFSSLFAPRPEPESKKSVTDFLSQERPGG